MKIVYLHGFASGPLSSKAQFFRRKLEARGADVSIPALDAGDFENLSISGQLRVIDQEVRGEPVALIGSSMGGYLASLYAALHPEVDRLVLLAPAFCFPRRWPSELGAEIAEAWRKSGYLELYHYGDGCQRRLSYGLIEDAALYPEEPDFTQPALVFHGRADDVVPVAYSEQYAARHPNVKLRVLESDHQLTNVVETIWTESESFLLG
jgi:pimeloyl-ACP methyl ester carboxylesterase